MILDIARNIAPDPRVKAILTGIDGILTYAPKIGKFLSNNFGKLGTVHKNDQNAANFDYIKYAIDPLIDPSIHNMKPNNVPWAFARARSTVQFDVTTTGTSFAFACAPFSCAKDKANYTDKDWTDMPFAIWNSDYSA
jgi:hypothetical protein